MYCVQGPDLCQFGIAFTFGTVPGSCEPIAELSRNDPCPDLAPDPETPGLSELWLGEGYSHGKTGAPEGLVVTC